MVTKEVIVKNSTGLHARPATLLVKKASAFKSDISLEYNGKKANVKS
ncbi:MAG: HPr family phosphocarrier protein, partial [Clostridium perfringens]|nr:HPr family phosphocarrier protein [Clostridium perfringens]MDU7964565.1 HPr family phosphocarrier protein [Clostridium perfringens]